MEMAALTTLADAGESLLETLTLTGESATPAQLDALSDLDGALRHVVDTLDRGEAYDMAPVARLVAALAGATGAGAPSAAREGAFPPGAADAPAAPAPALHLGEAWFASRPAAPGPDQTRGPRPAPPVAAPAAAAGPAGAAPLFMPPSSSIVERRRTKRRALTEDITSVELAEVERAVDLFGRGVTTRTMIAQGVDELRRPATETMRNSQRLRAVIEKLAAEFELVRRERRAATQGDDWDALELETFDAYTQIMLELGEIIADQEEIAGTLTDGVRRTAILCESDHETAGKLQKSLLGFRLVNLNTIEPRLDQVIMSTARAVGKTVTWELRGGSVAVDKRILDMAQEPLLHLLRNAIDHGLEDPEERARRGKNPLGAITIEASYGANSVIVRVSDDGHGIDPARVAAAAVRRGALGAGEAAALDADAKIALIWHPGFSTAATVTDISGRGVGLDIVRGAIEQMRGSVTVHSTVGEGTTFTLTLPLSLSVVRTLVLRDGDATVAAPITQIDGIHLVRRDDIATLGDRTVAMVEGRTVTLLDQGLARPERLRERLGSGSVVMLDVRVSPTRTVGLIVDEVLGEEDTLVKALPRYVQHHTTFVGCSVAGNGRPYAIVDLRQLVARSEEGSAAPPARAGAAAQVAKPLALIVDDSLFMRRSLTEVYEGGGFRVETAEDGEEALAIIARGGLPDLVSLDMEMPRMNGLEFLSVFRQLPGGQGVPVFMITTRGQERHRKAALAAGVSRYFIKPFDSEDLLAAALVECRASRAPAAHRIA